MLPLPLFVDGVMPVTGTSRVHDIVAPDVPVVGVKFTGEPVQTANGVNAAQKVGVGLTTTFTVCVLVQPFAVTV